MVIVTGALHEDGLSDFFDGFGGGRDKERILAIMKESTIGAYGVIPYLLFVSNYAAFHQPIPYYYSINCITCIKQDDADFSDK